MYSIAESERYASHLAELGDIQNLARALEGLRWAVENNPYAFQAIPGNDAIRVAKTEALTKTDGTTVRLRVWIKINDPRNVTLLLIESIQEI